MPKDKSKEVFMEITNKEIYELLQDTHKQTVKTNGRVTKLEKKSLGLWISDHPFKFVLGALIFIALVISDLRHPVLDLVSKIFT